MENLFFEQQIEEAIDRIKRFEKLAKSMSLPIDVGFSGGKDSQVVWHLCKLAHIEATAFYNVCFESSTTRNFIKTYYPEVVFRQYVRQGFFHNAIVNHNCMLPTSEFAYCCNDYKHNLKYAKNASITGVRRQESQSRRYRPLLSIKNKTVSKKITADEYFANSCMGLGSPSPITLNPIVDWYEDEVWEFCAKYSLPRNPEYNVAKRVGCMICPKCRFKDNFMYLFKYPKLVDCAIMVREKGINSSWYLTIDKQDYENNKVYYICRWLNHSFQPFSKKEFALYEQFRKRYDSLHCQYKPLN